MPAEIEVSEQCSHCAAGAEVTGRCDCPCRYQPKEGGSAIAWTLHMAICAECEGNRPQMVEEIRKAIGRADPFDHTARAKEFLTARRALDEAACTFARSQKYGDAVALANRALDFERAKKYAPPESAGN